MIILAWNCRGIAGASTIRTLRTFCRSHRPDLIFLSETKVQPQAIQSTFNRLGYPFLLQVPPSGLRGGLVVAWKPGVEAEPVILDQNQISCLIYSDPPHNRWLLSCVYAPPTREKRAEFWHKLSLTGNSFGGSWLAFGDFNAVLYAREKSGGRGLGSSSSNVFADFVNINGLVDLGFNGNPFTWSNHRQGMHNIRERLDRGLANQNWLHLFPNALVYHLPAVESDHTPMILSTSGTYNHLPKPFRFEAFWIRDPSCIDVVVNAWDTSWAGTPAFVLCSKWRNTKKAFIIWNRDHFGRIQSNIKAIMKDIDTLQKSPPSNQNTSRDYLARCPSGAA
jgi:hypothetical protein